MLESKLKVFANYNMGLITNNERYNQVIDGLLQMLNWQN
jgi:hypothetical protein